MTSTWTSRWWGCSTKGHRPRALPLGRTTAQAQDRSLGSGRSIDLGTCRTSGRTQQTHDALGVYQVVPDRARAAGLPAMHPHQLRHAFATSWLAEGGKENELMPVAGWKSQMMIHRSPTATTTEPARTTHTRPPTEPHTPFASLRR